MLVQRHLVYPPFFENVNSAFNAGFYAGGGSIVQFQFSADGRRLASRFRDRNIWSEWIDFSSKATSDTQKFDGQLVSHNDLFSFDKSNPTNYFELLKLKNACLMGFIVPMMGLGILFDSLK
ncbi:hypothetical protein ACV772_002045 [Proteus mirabilis]|uniref:hypothetical protein n=1 Tax=Proteus TaxID=583 RepID=UPI00137769AC|nr:MULTISPECIES: hypothetical protein [Proteus]EKW6534396.1 hypothetical protein [Proteus mirabilis]ELA7642753.1 hypothetical protein [Proteus mirabilis]ELW9234634.1 hypothetical protein [Proteus mirabilis]EMF0796056.1 hypothetical protein [Proteus mirabilis]MBG2931237.1 hypothetical protein [Proteus mirabilis]